MPTRSRKILLSTAILGATGAVAGLGVFAAFTAQTTNANNSIASGTVTIDNSGAGISAIYTPVNQGPGASTQRCIRVRYTGSLPSTVKLFKPTAVTNGTAFNIVVERGSGLSGTFPSCTGFATAATLYTGTLGAFPANYAAGPDARGSAWNQNDAVDYRFTVSVVDDPTPNAHAAVVSSGAHDFTWEARNN